MIKGTYSKWEIAQVIIGGLSFVASLICGIALFIRNSILQQAKFGFVKGDIFIWDGTQVGLLIGCIISVIITVIVLWEEIFR